MPAALVSWFVVSGLVLAMPESMADSIRAFLPSLFLCLAIGPAMLSLWRWRDWRSKSAARWVSPSSRVVQPPGARLARQWNGLVPRRGRLSLTDTQPFPIRGIPFHDWSNCRGRLALCCGCEGQTCVSVRLVSPRQAGREESPGRGAVACHASSSRVHHRRADMAQSLRGVSARHRQITRGEPRRLDEFTAVAFSDDDPRTLLERNVVHADLS